MIKKILMIMVSCFLVVSDVLAEDLTFSWLPNTESDLAGYKIHYGKTAGQYDSVVDCKLPETSEDGRVRFTIKDVSGDKLFFVATAYDTDGNESEPSNTVEYNPKPDAPSGFKLNMTININITGGN